jgi:hypothetical protein
LEEAIVDDGENYEAHIPSVDTLAKIAQAYVDGRLLAVPICPNCDGTGLQPSRGAVNWGLEWKCDTCGGSGYDLPDEMVERVALGLWVEDSRARPENYEVWSHLTEQSRAAYRRQARAALVALFDHEKGA